MSDGTEIYGIEVEVWATMGWQAKFEVVQDTLEEAIDRLASLEDLVEAERKRRLEIYSICTQLKLELTKLEAKHGNE